MEWQPRTWNELVNEWPYASLVLTMSTVIHNMKESRKEIEASSRSKDISDQEANPDQVRAALESKRNSEATGDDMEEG